MKIICFTMFLISTSSLAINELRDYLKKIENNHEIFLIEKAKIDKSESERKIAKSRVLPKVSLRASSVYGDSSINSNSKYNEVSLTLSQPIYNSSNYRRFELGAIQKESANLNGQVQKANFYQKVITHINYYFNSKRHMEIAKKNYELMRESLRATKKRLKAGELTKTDLNRTLAQFRSDLALYRKYATEFEMAKENYKISVSKELPNKKLMKDFENLKVDEMKEIIELKFRKKIIEEKEKNVHAEKGNHLPTLNLIGRYSYNDRYRESIGEEREAVVGLQLEIPIYSGGEVSNSIKAKVYDRDIERYNFSIRKRELESLSTTLKKNLKRKKDILTMMKSSEQSMYKALKGIQREFRFGARSLTDVLNAKKELTQVRHEIVAIESEMFEEKNQIIQLHGVLVN